MLYLPEECRYHFREPFGTLYPSLDPVFPLLEDHLFFSVGDVVTGHLLAAGKAPDIAIIDGQTMRRPYEGVKIPHYRQVMVTNPAGCLSDELIQSISNAVLCSRTVIQVSGEEDLAVVPLAIHAPDQSRILYGQPGEGVVLLIVNEEIRKKAASLLHLFTTIRQ